MLDNICNFTQCIRCDNWWHMCKQEIVSEDENDAECHLQHYCLFCGHCQYCGCCGPCGKPECEEEHI